MRRFLCMSAMLAAAISMAGQRAPQFKHYEDENDQEQAALEGKAPPPFTATEWVNSKPLNWKQLKGKVVLVDLWAYW